MITKEDIKKITDKCKEKGCDVKVKDIAFILLLDQFSDPSIPYRVLFESNVTEKEVDDYLKSKNHTILKDCIAEENINIKLSAYKTNSEPTQDITFEQNKEALIKMLDKINEAVKNGELDTKDAIKAEKDIRVALNDKFGTFEETNKQFIFVEAKFNHICEWTRKECFLQTKEYAKKQWNLYEKDEVMKDIKKEYDLIPKSK